MRGIVIFWFLSIYLCISFVLSLYFFGYSKSKVKKPKYVLTNYKPYESDLLDKQYDSEVECKKCGLCGMDDVVACVNIYGKPICIWCRELSMLRYHRWQEAARMERGYKWMKSHDATGD